MRVFQVDDAFSLSCGRTPAVLVDHRADQPVALCAEAAAKELVGRRAKTRVEVQAATCAKKSSQKQCSKLSASASMAQIRAATTQCDTRSLCLVQFVLHFSFLVFLALSAHRLFVFLCLFASSRFLRRHAVYRGLPRGWESAVPLLVARFRSIDQKAAVAAGAASCSTHYWNPAYTDPPNHPPALLGNIALTC
jgi:hypothetical protein